MICIILLWMNFFTYDGCYAYQPLRNEEIGNGFRQKMQVRLRRGLKTRATSYNGSDPWSELTCDFDDYTMCGWSNENPNFRWTLGEGKDSWRGRRRGKTRTGTKGDVTGGAYIYITSDRGQNRTALLATKYYEQTEPACFQFYYHMRGRHMGHLKVLEYLKKAPAGSNTTQYTTLVEASKPNLLWAIYGQQGNDWKQGKIALSKLTPSQRRKLVFEGFDWERGRAGNIVLDDFNFAKDSGDCFIYPYFAAPPKSTSIPRIETTAPNSYGVINTQQNTASFTSVRTGATQFFNKVSERAFPTLGTDLPKTQRKASKSAINKTTSAVPTELYQESSSMVDLYVNITYVNITAHQVTMYSQSATDANSQSSQFDQTLVSVDIDTASALGSTVATFSNEISSPRTADTTVKQQDVVKVTNRSSSQTIPTIPIAVGVTSGLIALVVFGILYYRYKKRQKFNYYDNCTVHMTRMSPEIVSPGETDMQYYKLT